MIDFIDNEGTSGWFTLTVVAFWIAWPCGAAVVAFLAFSGRLNLWWNERSFTVGRWSNARDTYPPSAWGGFTPSRARANDNRGNCRMPETEQEHREFRLYLERLRGTRD